MKPQETVKSGKRGPKPTGKGTPVLVRLQPEMLDALDAFVSDHDASLSRPEALRRAFSDWAIAHGYLRPSGSVDEGMRPEDLNASNDD